MIEVGIVDLSAEGRRKLAALVERWTWINPDSRNLTLPRISTHLLSPEELRFHGSLDVCLVGPELLSCDVAYLSILRKHLPRQILICVLDSRSYSFGMIEQLGRLEVDDVLMDTAAGDEFFRRLILLQRRVSRKEKGKIVVVDAARGGVGATFVTAGLSEHYLNQGHRVVAIDGDVVSQDLSRFLQAKPFVNEPLKMLLEQGRVIAAETVRECVFQVWEDEDRFGVVSPPAASDEAVFSTPQASRAFASILDVLCGLYDFVVIDSSALLASLRHSLYQLADEVVFVSNRDPAGAYANRHALALISGGMRREARLVAVLNHTGGPSTPVSILRDEVLIARDRELEIVSIPFSTRASSWACSGSTPAKSIGKYFLQIANQQESRAGSAITPQQNRLFLTITSVYGKVNRFFRKTFQAKSKLSPEFSTENEAKRPGVETQEQTLYLDTASDSELVSRPTMANY